MGRMGSKYWCEYCQKYHFRGSEVDKRHRSPINDPDPSWPWWTTKEEVEVYKEMNADGKRKK